VSFQILGRALTQSSESGLYVASNFGTQWSLKEIFADLAKVATRKELLLASSDDFLDDDDKQLEAGTYSKHLFIALEEEFDTDAVRIVNTGTIDIDVSILEVGFIYNDANIQTWGMRVAVTRKSTSVESVSYSFQVWGQYVNRVDFCYPFYITAPDSISTILEKPLNTIIDTCIEDVVNKLLQICFTGNGSKYKFFLNANGHGEIRAYDVGVPVTTLNAFNTESVSRNAESPVIIDRLQVKGQNSEAYLQTVSMEKIYVCARTEVGTLLDGVGYETINFDKPYATSSLELRNVHGENAEIIIYSRKLASCEVKIYNTSLFSLEYTS
jgi:hypothetical protein